MCVCWLFFLCVDRGSSVRNHSKTASFFEEFGDVTATTAIRAYTQGIYSKIVILLGTRPAAREISPPSTPADGHSCTRLSQGGEASTWWHLCELNENFYNLLLCGVALHVIWGERIHQSVSHRACYFFKQNENFLMMDWNLNLSQRLWIFAYLVYK